MQPGANRAGDSGPRTSGVRADGTAKRNEWVHVWRRELL